MSKTKNMVKETLELNFDEVNNNKRVMCKNKEIIKEMKIKDLYDIIPNSEDKVKNEQKYNNGHYVRIYNKEKGWNFFVVECSREEKLFFGYMVDNYYQTNCIATQKELEKEKNLFIEIGTEKVSMY